MLNLLNEQQIKITNSKKSGLRCMKLRIGTWSVYPSPKSFHSNSGIKIYFK